MPLYTHDCQLPCCHFVGTVKDRDVYIQSYKVRNGVILRHGNEGWEYGSWYNLQNFRDHVERYRQEGGEESEIVIKALELVDAHLGPQGEETRIPQASDSQGRAVRAVEGLSTFMAFVDWLDAPDWRGMLAYLKRQIDNADDTQKAVYEAALVYVTQCGPDKK